MFQVKSANPLSQVGCPKQLLIVEKHQHNFSCSLHLYIKTYFSIAFRAPIKKWVATEGWGSTVKYRETSFEGRDLWKSHRLPMYDGSQSGTGNQTKNCRQTWTVLRDFHKPLLKRRFPTFHSRASSFYCHPFFSLEPAKILQTKFISSPPEKLSQIAGMELRLAIH